MKNNEEKQYYEETDGSIGKIAYVTGTATFKIVVLLVLAVALYLGGKAAYKYGYEMFNGATMEKAPGTDVKITVKEDMSHSELADLLVKKGLIEDSTAMRLLFSIFTNSSYDVLPGEYTLNTSMTMREMIDEMVGEVATEEPTSDYLGLYD